MEGKVGNLGYRRNKLMGEREKKGMETLVTKKVSLVLAPI
jgi:hypothetical protein